jgi:hypothetical protein
MNAKLHLFLLTLLLGWIPLTATCQRPSGGFNLKIEPEP